MRTKLIQGLVGAAAVVAMAGVGAAPAVAATAPNAEVHAAAESEWSVVGTNTLTMDPAFASSLANLGIEHYAFRATKTEGTYTAYAFDVTGDPTDGTTELRGGIVFTGDCEYAAVSGLVIDTATGMVSGRLNFGARIDLFRLGGTTSQGVTWHFTSAGAAAFNEALEITTIRSGRVLGYDATVLA